ncbi:myotubularin-related protein 14-like protein [Dinothrombium tinctorium]|uniref:Myotubularin-related protein 14-like protein n=1 Tax=Dinothrombium tinctorium TaxID=1965070 RepID=A0A3S3PDD5_9ACAR|nr:myotubularin-related protein 14-like protein [Dinothrombium tinctorium]RWS14170.1 myotubularin-related protein 14-like protein [Dinothrombium tinctorium]RWS14456.1 myotubularin-related protein 14-like protein [Dinothrombium tinctorium]
MAALSSEDLRKLLELFTVSCFKPKDADKRSETVQNRCLELMLLDYKQVITISNETGELCSSYPSKIIVPQRSTNECCANNAFDSSQLDSTKLRELILKARIARCRARFPVPVILFDNKYICRSATLSCGPEIYGRKGFDLLFTTNSSDRNKASSSATQHSLSSLSSLTISDSSQVFSTVRNHDINLLKYVSVGYICDLMVEKKKVKFCVNITSSEKADKESRYSDFEILSLPYPGCEFFRDYRDNDYYAEGLVFDWQQHFIDADLDIPKEVLNCDLGIEWNKYRTWDIVTLTRNYLKLLLFYLNKNNNSLLIHCISGWDRTPLFISLLRLTLWADGKIHQNLSPLEITYLTVAYDWYLFGHNLSDRIAKGEEILFFCFYFLKFITESSFCVDSFSKYTKADDSTKVMFLGTTEAEEASSSLANNHNSKIHGSSSSLDSTSSTSSCRSGPPLFFPCIDESFVCTYSPPENDFYPSTPPTLTNSEEGSQFLVNSTSDKTTTFGESTEAMNISIKNTEQNICNSSKSTPMAIPSTGSKQSHVPKNTSLNRSDSWQIVSETGSVSSKSFYSSPESIGSLFCSVKSNSQPTQQLEDCKPSLQITNSNLSRKEKLQAVRSLFYNSYSAAVGFRFRSGSDVSGGSGLSNLFDHITGTVAKKTSSYYF